MTTNTGSIDVLVSGGRAVDPVANLDGMLDVAISGGKLAAIGPSLRPSPTTKVIDATGGIVLPGLVDLHVHSYYGVNHYGTNVDPICLSSGVTTAVDAGSSGPVNFAGFKELVASRATTRHLAFVCVAKHGVTASPGELLDLRFADAEGAARTVTENPDVAVGIKVRLSDDTVGEQGREALRLAIQAGEWSESPVMVHIGGTSLPIEEIVETLRPGDIVTHCFTPKAPCLTNDRGTVRQPVLEAHERGVLFDVGHAGGHFGLDVARACIAEGLFPDVISTDVHRLISERRIHLNLPLAMSKLLALGMSLPDVLRAVTFAPADAIGWSDRLGQIVVGREADLCVLDVNEGAVVFRDVNGQEMQGKQSLRARWTVRAGVSYAGGAADQVKA